MTLRACAVYSCLLACGLYTSATCAQEAEEKLTLTIYRVADIVRTAPDYPYRPGLPTTESPPDESPAMTAGSMGGLGGQAGGGVGGGGGGFFQVPDKLGPAASSASQTLHQFGGGDGGLGGTGMILPAADVQRSAQFSIDELREAIMGTIAPDSWIDVGGAGNCTVLGYMLLIRQTAAVHTEIKQLLADIREQSGARKLLTVEAHWVTLTPEALAKVQQAIDTLRKGENQKDAAQATLRELLTGPGAQVTCHSDQTVHVTSGERRTVITSVIATVGFGSVGYTPQVSFPNVGTLLEVKPSLEPDGKAAVVNIRSTVTAWQEGGEPVRFATEIHPAQNEQGKTTGGRAEAVVDRVNLKTRHIATTIRATVGIPQIVGSFPAEDDMQQGSYLVLRVTVTDTP